mgnify:CR=1 FL=1
MAEKKTVMLTGASGNMGFAGVKELHKKKDLYNTVLSLRRSYKNEKLFPPHASETPVKIDWDDHAV